MEQEDYSKIYEYESIGKEYAGEKACISLTSWKARINTVSKTLYSLLKMCPGFHIVLVLSKDEFPLMEKELPDNLMLFVENKLIELFWIKPNLKSFKKVLFTMDKYRDVPVISADDDCIYTCNYAQELYDAWKKSPNCVIAQSKLLPFRHLKIYGGGWGTIYPTTFIKQFKKPLCDIHFDKLSGSNDDLLYSLICFRCHIHIKTLNKQKLNQLCIYAGNDKFSITATKQATNSKQYNSYCSFIKDFI